MSSNNYSPKALKGTKTLGQKHKNANKRISDYFYLKKRSFLYAFHLFKDLSKAFACMTNGNRKYTNTHNLILKKRKEKQSA